VKLRSLKSTLCAGVGVDFHADTDYFDPWFLPLLSHICFPRPCLLFVSSFSMQSMAFPSAERQGLYLGGMGEGTAMLQRQRAHWKILLVTAIILVVAPVGAVFAQEALPTIRLAVLKYGSVAWERNVIEHHGLDHKHGFTLDTVELAGTQALKVALQANRVDIILSDWLWVSRIRQMGSNVTFAPYGVWVGGLMVSADSPVQTLAALRDRRLGIAGGPIDKNWLLLQALVVREEGIRLAEATDAVFGAPPLLRMQLQQGRLDAVLTYWQDVAKLRMAGFRLLIDMAEVAKRLGIQQRVPFLGYVFSESWAEKHKKTVRGFLAASREAKEILRDSDMEWDRISPLTRTQNEIQLNAIRDAYRLGLLDRWGNEERAAAKALFRILAKIGGKPLTGGHEALAAGTFWAEDQF